MPNPAYVATVKANGQNYISFESLTVNRSFSDMISYFQLTCSEGGLLGGANDARRLVPGTPVQIYLGGQLVLTGAVTTRAASFDANGHTVIIGGRSATADGPDSAIPINPGNFDGYGAEQAARGVLQPHGTNLNVVNPPSSWSKPFPYLAVNPGEHVGEFLERICKMRGAFLWDDEQGNLCAGQGDPSAASVADLQEDLNILRATIKLDDQGLYSAVNYYGQQPAQGDEFSNRTAQGTATNPGTTTTRIRVEHAEHAGDSDDMTARANLEAARSGWDQVEATVTVAGWFRSDGLLWGLTNNVTLYSPMGLPNGTGQMTLGIQSVVYSQIKDAEGEGTTTTMTLVRPQFLTSTPFANVQSNGSGGYGDSGSTPAPAQPVPPDTSGTSISPQGGPIP